MTNGAEIAAIVLAAGGSSRHGSPKQLRRIDGKSLVRRAADTVLESGFRPGVVVLGSSFEAILPELEGSGADVVVNPQWREGVSSSIRAGLARVRSAAPQAEAVLIFLADQPLVEGGLLRSLAGRYARGPERAVACRYEGVLGPPAIFSHALFERLEALTGDEGARSLLRSAGLPVASIDFPDAALDIDTPSDGIRL